MRFTPLGLQWENNCSGVKEGGCMPAFVKPLPSGYFPVSGVQTWVCASM